jgi:hypothetical protein
MKTNKGQKEWASMVGGIGCIINILTFQWLSQVL